MSFATPVQAPEATSPSADERLVMYNIPWSGFEAQLALRGDNASPRIAYLDGAMELRSPSRDHERLKSYLGCLVEAYAFERDLDLSPYGGWPLRAAPRQAGLEPDECYIIGPEQRLERPHLAIEVVWTSSRLDKLEIYRRLQVPEVWIWRDGTLQVHVLRDGSYEAVDHSEQLPGIDLALLVSFLDHPTALQAVRAYHAKLQE
jgi:Uma2 family endonuclease